MVQLDHKDLQVPMVPRGHKESRVKKETKEILVIPGRKDP